MGQKLEVHKADHPFKGKQSGGGAEIIFFKDVKSIPSSK